MNVSRKAFTGILLLVLLMFGTSISLAQNVSIVEGQSIAGASLGMTRQQVRSTLGNKAYSYGGYDVHYDYAGRGGAIFVRYSGGSVSELVAKPMTWAPSAFYTGTGIHTGGEGSYQVLPSTPAEIEAAYPGIHLTVDNPGAGANQIKRQYRLGDGTVFTYRMINFFCGYTCSNLVETLEISLGG